MAEDNKKGQTPTNEQKGKEETATNATECQQKVVALEKENAELLELQDVLQEGLQAKIDEQQKKLSAKNKIIQNLKKKVSELEEKVAESAEKDALSGIAETAILTKVGKYFAGKQSRGTNKVVVTSTRQIFVPTAVGDIREHLRDVKGCKLYTVERAEELKLVPTDLEALITNAKKQA